MTESYKDYEGKPLKASIKRALWDALKKQPLQIVTDNTKSNQGDTNED